MTQRTVDADMSPPPRSKSLTVQELAQCVQGDVEGDGGAIIIGVSSIEEADFGDVVFAENPRFLNAAAKSRASAIVSFLDAVSPDKPLIKVANPRYAFAQILGLFTPNLNAPAGVHPTAVVGHGVHIGENVSVGPGVVVGDHVVLGDRVRLLGGVRLGDACKVGADTVLYPNVVLYADSVLGERVVIHAGSIIGADGFGYMRVGDHSYKVPHIGTVEIGDDVEIGANCTVDRAKTGATVIGSRTKVDNLVHIAHNCKVGEDCIIIAQVGVAGSVQMGRGVIVAGQAGIKDHVSVGDGAVVLGASAVFGSIEAGATVSGIPARPHRQRLRQDAAATQLPEYQRRVRELEKANQAMRDRSARLEALVETMARRLGIDVPSEPDAAAGAGD